MGLLAVVPTWIPRNTHKISISSSISTFPPAPLDMLGIFTPSEVLTDHTNSTSVYRGCFCKGFCKLQKLTGIFWPRFRPSKQNLRRRETDLLKHYLAPLLIDQRLGLYQWNSRAFPPLYIVFIMLAAIFCLQVTAWVESLTLIKGANIWSKLYERCNYSYVVYNVHVLY